MKNKVWILLLNWKNATDTIACLDSILECDDAEIQGVVLCDNGSEDGSIEVFVEWQKQKKLPFKHYFFEDKKFLIQNSYDADTGLDFILIENGANLGFAAGNNIGLDYLKQHIDFDFVFLLNNDTLIQNNTVSAMVNVFAQNKNIGLCGSTVIYEQHRDLVQAYGGAKFNKWLGRAVDIGTMTQVKDGIDAAKVVEQLDYILGAATMISKKCLNSIGNMEESYFLYYEEIDWAVRAKRKGFALGVALASIVFHKEGASIGSSYDKTKRSQLSTYYLTASKIRFTIKTYPYVLPFVFVFSFLQAIRSLAYRDFESTKTMFRAMFLRPFD